MTCYNNDNNNPNLSAATEIFAEYGDFILTILRSKIHKDHQVDIDDLYQDLFLSFVAKPVPENVQNIKGYLYRAITNRIYNNTRGIERYRNLKKKYAKNYNNYINNDNPKNA
ncbi:MAG: sigma-70 family RNA polymerase sigma factor, partial [Planctomycetes bacterium]|nr:sigma-70 family RNA polymerase sigma factor [Planctomycetota bacterium]